MKIYARRRPWRWSIDLDLKEVGGTGIAIFGRQWVKPSFAQFCVEEPLHVANLAQHMVEMGWPEDGEQLSMRRITEAAAEQAHNDFGQRARGAGGGGAKRRRAADRSPLEKLLDFKQDEDGKSLRTLLNLINTVVNGVYDQKSVLMSTDPDRQGFTLGYLFQLDSSRFNK